MVYLQIVVAAIGVQKLYKFGWVQSCPPNRHVRHACVGNWSSELLPSVDLIMPRCWDMQHFDLFRHIISCLNTKLNGHLGSLAIFVLVLPWNSGVQLKAGDLKSWNSTENENVFNTRAVVIFCVCLDFLQWNDDCFENNLIVGLWEKKSILESIICPDCSKP